MEQALALIAEGIDGLDEHDEGVVENAISSEHPWVSAIYDECKETGDVRGLMVRWHLCMHRANKEDSINVSEKTSFASMYCAHVGGVWMDV